MCRRRITNARTSVANSDEMFSGVHAPQPLRTNSDGSVVVPNKVRVPAATCDGPVFNYYKNENSRVSFFFFFRTKNKLLFVLLLRYAAASRTYSRNNLFESRHTNVRTISTRYTYYLLYIIITPTTSITTCTIQRYDMDLKLLLFAVPRIGIMTTLHNGFVCLCFSVEIDVGKLGSSRRADR